MRAWHSVLCVLCVSALHSDTFLHLVGLRCIVRESLGHWRLQSGTQLCMFDVPGTRYSFKSIAMEFCVD